tara:strand:+ start:2517 stop:3638 length:1122 start_codon:yes stop_codon:yes gene_type:complete
MKFLYKINSSYDGFSPDKIKERKNGAFLKYNWREYFDDVNEGDIIFTLFKGRGIKRGIYLVSKVTQKIIPSKSIICKIIHYDENQPLIEPSEFSKYERQLIPRPYGAVYVIPPFLDIEFEKIQKEITISEIDVGTKIYCKNCLDNNANGCENCLIFNKKYLIKWGNEVKLKTPYIEQSISPFWVLPYQSHWIKTNIRQHAISQIIYAFKAGYKKYANLLALGIKKEIEIDPIFNEITFDFIVGIPLSPKKKTNGEIDRVAEICTILKKMINVKYIPDALLLTNHISRREYKSLDIEYKFSSDYYTFLKINTPDDLSNKKILLIDDIITDGKTLSIAAKKIKEKFSNCQIYSATAGIMAKKRNMKFDVIKKFKD